MPSVLFCRACFVLVLSACGGAGTPRLEAGPDAAMPSPDTGAVEPTEDDRLRALLAAGDAPALARALESRDSTTLAPGPPPNNRIAPRTWALVAAPRIEKREDGTLEFVGWFGSPPGFYPHRVTLRASPSGRLERIDEDGDAVAGPDPDPLKSLVDALRSDDVANVRWGIETAANSGETAAIPALVAVLAHGDGIVRGAAAIALGRVGRSGDAQAFDGLVTALAREADGNAASMMVRGLNHLRDVRAVPPVARVLAEHPSEDARTEAADALALLGGPDARAALVKAADGERSTPLRERIKGLLARLPADQ